MSSVQVQEVDPRALLDADEASQLRQSFRGQVIRRDDPDYDEARRVWNGMIDKRPAMIARCSGTADVMAAVDFARDRAVPLSIRGGGHNVAGRAVCDDGLVIDLSHMRAVHVDPVNRIVQAQGGAILGDIDHETQAFDLAVPLGLVTATGIAGLTLHGGMGWLTRKYGLTLDNLIAADVVTADGHLLRASDTEHSDLFWAIRGGGGNFGVVTTFEFLAHPVGPDVWFLATIYPISQARKILKFVYNFMIDAPEHLGLLATLWNAPQEEPIAPEHRGEPVVILIGCWSGPFEQGEEIIRPLREITRPIADLSGPRRYLDVQRFFDADYPNGMLYYWKSAYLKRLDDEVIDALVHHAQTRPSSLTSLDLWFLCGAMNRVPADKTAYTRRDARYALAIESWTDPQQSDVNIAWSREVFDDMQRFSRGSYLNFPGFVEDQDRLLREAYGSNLDRLRDIKARYDPDNLFQGVLNISPAG
jgi:FAD/FMN-containing dehydrogenase